MGVELRVEKGGEGEKSRIGEVGKSRIGEGGKSRIGEGGRQGRCASHERDEGECSGVGNADRWGSAEGTQDRDGEGENLTGRDADIHDHCSCSTGTTVPASGPRAPSALAPCAPWPDPRALRGDGLGAREARGG